MMGMLKMRPPRLPSCSLSTPRLPIWGGCRRASIPGSDSLSTSTSDVDKESHTRAGTFYSTDECLKPAQEARVTAFRRSESSPFDGRRLQRRNYTTRNFWLPPIERKESVAEDAREDAHTLLVRA